MTWPVPRDPDGQRVILEFRGAYRKNLEQLRVQRAPVKLKDQVGYLRSQDRRSHAIQARVVGFHFRLKLYPIMTRSQCVMFLPEHLRH